MSPRWDPGRYLVYGEHRLRPGLELIARIDHPAPRLVHDVGCGTGALTRVLAERWPDARVVGTDISGEMLAEARSTPSLIEWVAMDVRDWGPGPPIDVILSNAVLHWVPDHDGVILRLFRSLAPGGVLAFQMPLSWCEPSHRLIREILRRRGLGTPELRSHYDRRPVADPEHYGGLLRPGASSVDVWETRYHQELRGRDPVLTWVEGTALRPVLETLAGEERETFLAEYRTELAAAYPQQPSGVTVYPFPRLFVVATR